MHNTIKVEKWKGASKHFFKSVLWSDESNFDILVGNHGCHVLRAKEEGDRPVSHQCSVQEASISDGMGVHKCIWFGQLACFGRHYECWKVYKGFRAHMLPSRLRVLLKNNAKPHTEAITTAWLSSRRVRVLNWPACSPDLSPIENIWRFIKRKYVKDNHKLFSNWKPISGKNGTKFQHQDSRNS